jgi:hypothetical protein
MLYLRKSFNSVSVELKRINLILSNRITVTYCTLDFDHVI